MVYIPSSSDSHKPFRQVKVIAWIASTLRSLWSKEALSFRCAPRLFPHTRNRSISLLKSGRAFCSRNSDFWWSFATKRRDVRRVSLTLSNEKRHLPYASCIEGPGFVSVIWWKTCVTKGVVSTVYNVLDCDKKWDFNPSNWNIGYDFYRVFDSSRHEKVRMLTIWICYYSMSEAQEKAGHALFWFVGLWSMKWGAARCQVLSYRFSDSRSSLWFHIFWETSTLKVALHHSTSISRPLPVNGLYDHSGSLA